MQRKSQGLDLQIPLAYACRSVSKCNYINGVQNVLFKIQNVIHLKAKLFTILLLLFVYYTQY